jgi:hypothetical protein
MSAPKGNQYAKGNHGGGRFSIYKEHEYANALQEAFFNGFDTEKFIKIEKSLKDIEENRGRGKIRLIDFIIYRAYKNDNVLISLIRKIFPDRIENNIPSIGLVEALRAIAERKTVPQRREFP